MYKKNYIKKKHMEMETLEKLKREEHILLYCIVAKWPENKLEMEPFPLKHLYKNRLKRDDGSDDSVLLVKDIT